VKLVSLDIHLDQINTLTWLEIIVERDHLDLHHPPCRVVSQIGAMIHIERVRKVKL
jgi:hypothetical protein